MSRKMNSIVLSSGIAGIDWPASINLLGTANANISHFDNVMLNTKGKYDDLVFEKTEINAAHKKLKPQFKGYLTRLLKNDKSQISFLSDPIFLDSGANWQKLNEDKSYAFFFCSPEYYLAQIDKDSDVGINIDQQECLDNWLEDASKIWDFYVRYPDNTLLINVEDVARDPVSSVTVIAEFLGCELDDIDNNQAPNSVNTAMTNPIEKLSLLILQNMKLETIKASSELNELYENLALTSILADDALTYQTSERANIRLFECQNLIALISTRQVQLEAESASFAASHSELIGDNEKLKAEFATRTSALESSLAERTAENELALLQINQQQEELETSYLNAKELKGELATQTSRLETHLAELTVENELALLQINQLQEELETTFLNAKELKGEFATQTSRLETHLADLTAENELALLQINQLQEELETTFLNAKELKGEFATQTSRLETHLAELTAENELALLQINQLQEELETTFLNAKELTGELAESKSTLEIRLAERTAENERGLMQINQLQEELEATYLNAKELTGELAESKSTLETRLAERTVENERGLLQINQLQEELETSYLNAKELKGELAAGAMALETHISALTAENELTLLQINQLQEELEHYYIQYQKMTYSPKREISYVTDLNRVKVSLSLMNMN
jgi:hypothetical protein